MHFQLITVTSSLFLSSTLAATNIIYPTGSACAPVTIFADTQSSLTAASSSVLQRYSQCSGANTPGGQYVAGGGLAYPNNVNTEQATAIYSNGMQTYTYNYVGCYVEAGSIASNNAPNSRSLSGNGYKTENVAGMTLEVCAAYCNGSPYFYTEYYTNCVCGSIVSQGTNSLPQSSCNTACDGNHAEFCGGNAAINLFAQSGY